MGRGQESDQHPQARHRIRHRQANLRGAGHNVTRSSPGLRREDRHISIGRVKPGVLIVVAHTERHGRIRLISARPASRKERRVYHERTLR